MHTSWQQKTHKMSDPTDTNLAYFLDFDMAVLGKPWEQYKIYAQQIRQEYIHFPEKDYCNGRIKVLTSLKSGGTYVTPEFQKDFEEQAKKNMQNEIKDLENQLKQL